MNLRMIWDEFVIILDDSLMSFYYLLILFADFWITLDDLGSFLDDFGIKNW